MERPYVTAKVGKRYKRYIQGSYQSDTIPLERNTNLINSIMPYLELTNEDPMEVDDETIKIELPIGNKKVYNFAGKSVYVCNTLWRNRLSEDGQYQVKRFFENEFKKTFRTYMDCYVEQQKANNGDDCKCKIKEGIAAFLIQYHIDFTKQDIATLARDWYRHRDKVDENKRSPCVC